MLTRLTSLVPGLAALALATAPAAAHQATFTAVLEPAGPSFCQEESHVVACNGARVRSLVVDLTQYEGKPFTYTADLAGVTCDVWYVTSVAPPAATLVVCGSAAPGCPVRLRVGPSGVIGQWFLWWSPQTAFLPIDATLGTVMLGTPSWFLGSGPTAGAPPYHEAVIPNLPGIVGLDVHTQGAFMDIGPVGPLRLTNPACFTIAPFLPPCSQPGC